MPDPDAAARFDTLAPLVTPGAGAADVTAAQAAFAALRSALAAAPPAWECEPDTLFDPAAAFARHVPAPWPGPPAAARDAAPVPSLLEADLTAVASGRVTAPELLAAYVGRAQALQPLLNAFVTICPPGHPQAAPTRGPDGAPLFGAVIAVKDIVETADLRTTGGSLQRADFVPTADASCWARLRAAGAVTPGKTGTHEFAAGTTSENEAFGPVRNPFDPARVAGGSSGGSAAAVAAGMAAAALGSDTGGSVRIPAACCGVVGLKPTYGRVSRRGVFALSWSLDHVGPLARTVRDAALLLATLAGPDALDPTTLRQPALGDPATLGLPRAGGLHGLRVGVPAGWLEYAGASAPATGGLPTAPEVRQAFARALRCLAGLGAEVVAIDLGSPDHATAVNRVIALAESAAYHAPYLDRSPERYGARVRARLLAGRFLLAEEYLQAQRARAGLCRRYAAALAGRTGVHLVTTPTLPTLAPHVGAPSDAAAALLRFCAPFNVVGWPALTLPCGLSAEGLPVSLQLAAAPYRERELLAAAASVEQALGPDARPLPALAGPCGGAA